MNFITAKQLQRDFALPLIDTDRIIREQRRLASRRQWPLTALILCVLLPSVAVNFGGVSLPHAVSRWMPPVVISLEVVQQFLIHHAFRQPMLDAAHHLQRERNVCPTVMV